MPRGHTVIHGDVLEALGEWLAIDTPSEAREAEQEITDDLG